MTLPLPPASGWAVYSRTKSGKAAEIRLPKDDDEYYYFTKSGDKDGSESGLRALRDELSGGSGKAGKLTYQPTAGAQDYTINKGTADSTFVFGNPTMAYIDIWGMIADNNALGKGIKEQFSYLNSEGTYTTVTKSTASASVDTLIEPKRYLAPMQAIILKATSGTSLVIKLNATRVVTQAVKAGALPAPSRRSDMARSKGIMAITATNPVSPRCISRLLLGQGYRDAIYDGEDAILTTVNIDNFHMTNTPTTPFNLYSVNGGYGMCIDLRDSIVNIPVSFCMSNLPYDPVTYLWFSGVNSIDGPLVLYDALMDTERKIIDGICLDIETPESSNEKRYYIRRRGWSPSDSSNPTTGVGTSEQNNNDEAIKIIRNGQVYILRGGHVYTIFGQKLR